jgi:hypothetical protein
MTTTRWQCPKCDNTITLHINTTQPPHCNRHTPKPIAMTPTTRKQKT